MLPCFVAHADDALARKGLWALGGVRQFIPGQANGFPTRVIYAGESASPTDIILFTLPATDHPVRVSHRHVKMAAHQILGALEENGEVPEWFGGSPFVVGIRPDADPNSAHFTEAIRDVAYRYLTWASPERPPWGGQPTEAQKFELFTQWQARVERVGTFGLSASVFAHTRPHVAERMPPEEPGVVTTLLCPNYLEHGVLSGDPAQLNTDKLKATAETLAALQERSGQTLLIDAYIPDDGMTEEPWRYALVPSLWHADDLGEQLRGGHVALAVALDRIAQESGVMFRNWDLSSIPAELIEDSLPSSDSPEVRYLAGVLRGENQDRDFAHYSTETLIKHVRWSIACYIAFARDVAHNPLVLGMETGKEGWEAALPRVEQYRSDFNVFWLSARQHWTK